MASVNENGIPVYRVPGGIVGGGRGVDHHLGVVEQGEGALGFGGVQTQPIQHRNQNHRQQAQNDSAQCLGGEGGGAFGCVDQKADADGCHQVGQWQQKHPVIEMKPKEETI